MYKIFIFSGTTEGRELSEFLCKNKIENEVFVATEYGQIVMEKNEYAHINSGRLTMEEMADLFTKEKPKLIIDATHPYAVEVTDNIYKACQEALLSECYIRVLREIPYTDELLKEDFPDIEIVSSTQAAVSYLKKTEGAIFLTTGVKELSTYAKEPLLKDRIYARILPAKESILKAYESELLPRQIIAMEGPFSAEMNEATMKQYGIRVLVTKNSGIRGGFLEKLKAAENLKVQTLVIDPSKVTKGISPEEARLLLEDRYLSKNHDENKNKKASISVVGIGMETEDSITIAGKRVIEEADVIIGAKRMAEFGHKLNPRAKLIVEYKKAEVNKAISDNAGCKIAVLVSGDTGFFSLAAGIDNAKLYPGISSFSYLASKISIPYSDAVIKSFHGKNLCKELKDSLSERKLIKEIENINRIDKEDVKLTGEKVFCIFSNCEDVKTIVNANPDYHVYAGLNLGQDSEKIFEIKNGKCPELDEGLYTLCFIKSE